MKNQYMSAVHQSSGNGYRCNENIVFSSQINKEGECERCCLQPFGPELSLMSRALSDTNNNMAVRIFLNITGLYEVEKLPYLLSVILMDYSPNT